MDPLSRGRESYKERDYKSALEAFSEVVNCSTDNILLTALDHRAATLEKLGQLQPALKDAKHMIDLKPGRAKGYLRCAKVLQLKGEDALALKIYERGLKKVKVGEDPDRPILQQMFSKIQARQKQAKNFDLLVMLPNELAKMMFEYLGMRDLIICLAVSKRWKQFLEAFHDLWTELDFRHARRPVRLESLKAHLRRCNYKLDRAVINMNSSIFSAKFLDYITRTCKQLQYMELLSVGFLGDSLLKALPTACNLRTLIIRGSEMTLHSITEALTICHQLEVFECDSVKLIYRVRPQWPMLDSLRSFKLDIRESLDMSLMDLNSFMLSAPNIRSATIIHSRHTSPAHHYGPSLDFTKWKQLEYLEFRNSFLLQLPPFPKTLKHLDISGLRIALWFPTGLSATEDHPMEELGALETFICEKTANVNLETIYDLIEASRQAGSLKTLRLGDCLNANDEPRPFAHYAIPSLRTLSLQQWRAPEERLLAFLRHCPGLERLDASDTRITGVAIRELMTREAGPLVGLRLQDCAQLSHDAVEYARSMGAVVEYAMTQDGLGGRGSWRDRGHASGL